MPDMVDLPAPPTVRSAALAAPRRAAWVWAAVKRTSGSAVVMAMAAGAVLEYTTFRHAYLLADRSTLTIAYKGARLEEGHSEQVVVMGPSTALALDAQRLEAAAGGHLTFYNYALPNLGSIDQYYFVLKKYLAFNRPPELLILALPPDGILNESVEQNQPFIDAIERQRFRRFFGPEFLLTTVAPETHDWGFVAEAAETALPSSNFRIFIKDATFAREQDEQSDWEDLGSMQALLDRNHEILDGLVRTKGQLIYYGNKVVSASDVRAAMPAPPSADPAMARPFEELIRLADARGINTRLIFTPVCCSRAVALREDGTWAELGELLAGYEAKYPMFKVLASDLPTYPIELFGDAIHLNLTGADRFNHEIEARLPELLEPSAPRPHGE